MKGRKLTQEDKRKDGRPHKDTVHNHKGVQVQVLQVHNIPLQELKLR